MTGSARKAEDAPRRPSLYWRAHLVLLLLIAVPMLLFQFAYYSLSGEIAPIGIRLLPVLAVSGSLAWLLRDR